MKERRTRVAAYALIHREGRILLCRLSRDMPRWEGFWTLPGGGLNFGESPEAAVVREVQEETGFVIVPTGIATINSIHGASDNREFHGIRIIYFADIIGGQLRHETSGSTDRCDWHPLHPSLRISLVDLAEVGLRVARQTWPEPGIQ